MKSWEEEFDKNFPHTMVDEQGRPRLLIRPEREHRRLKHFISTLLADQNKQIIKELLKAMPKEDWVDKYEDNGTNRFKDAHKVPEKAYELGRLDGRNLTIKETKDALTNLIK